MLVETVIFYNLPTLNTQWIATPCVRSAFYVLKVDFNPWCSQWIAAPCAHCLSMYLGVCEKENHIFVFHTSHLVQLPQVFVEIVIIIPSAKFDLHTLVTTYMSCKSREGLLSRASYTNQQRVAPFLADHPCNSAGSKGRKIEFRFTGVSL